MKHQNQFALARIVGLLPKQFGFTNAGWGLSLNPMKTLDQQIDPLIPEWTKLFKALKQYIGDDYRASEDEDTPGMCVTIGFTPETEDNDASWNYQTGDNSFTGALGRHFALSPLQFAQSRRRLRQSNR